MYATPADPGIEQGDVFDGCPLAVLADAGGGVELVKARVVVLTQTCDLAQGKASRAVVAVCYDARVLADRQVLKASTIRDQIRPGRVHGWYYLPGADAPAGLPETVVDLRDLHTVPVPTLTALVAAGGRVCRVLTPYREHLAQHFAVTYMRIALPEPYETRP
jgi:hypothetical protein